jgi:hypothetical protein
MSSTSVRCTILLLSALLAAAAANAAGRASDTRQSSSKKASNSAATGSDNWRQDLETWLARLNGSFKIKLEIPPEIKCSTFNSNTPTDTKQTCTVKKTVPYVSAVNCRGIGQGPGLYCTFDDLRTEQTGKDAGTPGATVSMFSNALPSRMLLGIDPVAQKITMMVMDPGGQGYSEMATPVGKNVTFKSRCDAGGQKGLNACSWNFSISAPPDSRKIVMTRSDPSGSLSMFNEPHTFVLTKQE